LLYGGAVTSDRPKAARRARIPTGRLERLARIGWLAGEVTLGGLAEGARRWFGSDTVERSIFVTHMNAQRLAKRLSSLRGAAMKLGQLLSLEGDDYLPPEITGALARLRAGLRPRVLASPLFDAPRFAGNLEAAVWAMWQRWRGSAG